MEIKNVETRKNIIRKLRCRCRTNASLAKYASTGSKSVKYWAPCPIHEKKEKEESGPVKEI